MSFVGTTLLFLGSGLSFVGSVLSFVGGGLVCMGWGLMFVGCDCFVGSGCCSGMGAAFSSCHAVSFMWLLLLSVLLSVCAVGVVGGQSWLLVRCLGWQEQLVLMVVVGREGLLIDCSLLMTTNQVSGFANARFGRSEEITSVIELTLLPSNGCIVQQKECSSG